MKLNFKILNLLFTAQAAFGAARAERVGARLGAAAVVERVEGPVSVRVPPLGRAVVRVVLGALDWLCATRISHRRAHAGFAGFPARIAT